MSTKKPKLIVHIGQGKTGTSSVQYTLTKNENLLLKNGYKFLGYDLQNSLGYNKKSNYFDSDNLYKKKHSEIYKLLDEECSSEENYGLTLIWSNESIFNKVAFIPVLKLLSDKYEILIIGYVRRHDLWAKSAYIQWGIKHKMYRGYVQDFETWSKNSKGISYSKKLKMWDEAFHDKLIVHNFDAISDVVKDFMTILGIEDSKQVRNNETPTNELLYLWSLFNSKDPEPKHPDQFEKFASKMGFYSDFFHEYLSFDFTKILPTSTRVTEVMEEQKEDILEANRVLRAKGQPIFSMEPKEFADPNVIDNQTLIKVLFKTIFELEERIETLEKRVS